MSQYKGVIAPFLTLTEKASKGDKLDALDAFDFAVGAVGGMMSAGSSADTERSATVRQALNPQAFSWSDLAGAALHTTARTLIARQARGEQAAINALGTGIGEAIGYGITRQGMGNPVFNAIAGNIGSGVRDLGGMFTASQQPSADRKSVV